MSRPSSGGRSSETADQIRATCLPWRLDVAVAESSRCGVVTDHDHLAVVADEDLGVIGGGLDPTTSGTVGRRVGRRACHRTHDDPKSQRDRRCCRPEPSCTTHRLVLQLVNFEALRPQHQDTAELKTRQSWTRNRHCSDANVNGRSGWLAHAYRHAPRQRQLPTEAGWESCVWSGRRPVTSRYGQVTPPRLPRVAHSRPPGAPPGLYLLTRRGPRSHA